MWPIPPRGFCRTRAAIATAMSAKLDEQGAMGVGALSRQTVDESSRVSMI